MTTFKANRKFPNPITVTDDTRSHTLALQQIIEALNVGQRRTREIGSSYVRVSELVDVGLIEIVGDQLKLTNAGTAAVAGGASAFTATDMYDQTLSNLADVAVYLPRDGDVLTYDAATGLWKADDRPHDPEDFAVLFETDFTQGTYGSSSTFTQNGSSVSDLSTMDVNHPGILCVASVAGSGASASTVWQLGTSSVFTTMSSAGLFYAPAAPDYLDYEVIARIPDVLPPTIGEWQLGFSDFSGEAGAALIYLRGKDGVLDFLATRTGTGTTTVDVTSAAPADGAWFRLKIRVNTSELLCYINGALVARITTHLPTITNKLRPSVYATNNVTSTTPAVIVDVDYMRISRAFATARA